MPARGPYQKLSETDRARALACLDAGMGSREGTRRFRTSHQTINRIRQRYRQTGHFKERHRSGRPKVTTRAEDRYVTNSVVRNRFMAGPEARSAARGRGALPVSVMTVRNRIRAGGFKSRLPAKNKTNKKKKKKKKTELIQRHRDTRLNFSRAHLGWNNAELRRVMFSDESKFYLRRVDDRKRVWRRRGERHADATVVPRVALQGGGVIVLAGVLANAWTDRMQLELPTVHQRSATVWHAKRCIIRHFYISIGSYFITIVYFWI